MASLTSFSGPTADILQSLAWAFQTALQQDCRKLLGRPVSLNKPMIGLLPPGGILDPNPCAFVEGEIEGSSAGPLVLALDLRMAVTMSALLLMMPPDQIEAKRSLLEVSEADVDAVEEIGNVLCGALNRVLQREAGKHWHLKKRSVQVSGGTIPPGEYIIVTWPLRVETYDGIWHLLVPVAIGEALAEEIRKAKGEEAEVKEPLDGERTAGIAIIEGNEADGILLCQLLEREGFATALFSKPGELIQPTKASFPQAIILDVDSQPAWGVTTCRKLALDERTREIPVIAASRAPTAEMVVALARAGVRAFLVKPYTKETVLEKLTALGVTASRETRD